MLDRILQCECISLRGIFFQTVHHASPQLQSIARPTTPTRVDSPPTTTSWPAPEVGAALCAAAEAELDAEEALLLAEDDVIDVADDTLLDDSAEEADD